MGNTTSDLLIWTPDDQDTGEPDVYLATMAQSIEDGTGARLRKLESSIACNLSLNSALVADTTVRQVAVSVSKTYNFNDGMTVSGGSVTVPVAGTYSVQALVNYLGVNSTPGRMNTYLYLNGVSVAFASTYGNTNTLRYATTAIPATFKCVAGDTFALKVASYDANSNVASASLCISLVRPL